MEIHTRREYVNINLSISYTLTYKFVLRVVCCQTQHCFSEDVDLQKYIGDYRATQSSNQVSASSFSLKTIVWRMRDTLFDLQRVRMTLLKGVK